MTDILTHDEINTWKDFISLKQKTNADWDKIREKIPQSLLLKTQRVLNECRENGFCNPHVYEDRLIWSQIMGDKFGYKFQSKCDLCRNDFSGGKCKGKSFHSIEGHKDFKQC